MDTMSDMLQSKLDSPETDGGVFAPLSQPRRGLREETNETLERVDPAIREHIMTLAIMQSQDGIALIDKFGRVSYVNSAFESMSGFLSSELIGKNLEMLHSDVNSGDLFHSIVQTVKHGRIWFGRVPCRKKTGEVYWVFSQCSPLFDECHATILAYVLTRRDITAQYQMLTELKRVRTEMNHMQRLDCIGQLAGGIAHDFNNMLQGILGFAELAECEAGDNPSLIEDIHQVLSIVKKAQKLTRQLLVFGRKQSLSLVKVNLNDCIEKIKPMFPSLLGTSQAISIKLNPSVPFVLADTGQFEQVLINLMINARDAVENCTNPSITITTDIEVGPNDHVNDGNLEIDSEQYVIVTVTDNGTGMSSEVLAHIFDPYFTTKSVSKGTGLGLAVAYGIMKQHHGHIRAFSVLGQGTKFTLYFPVFASVTNEKTESVPLQPGLLPEMNNFADLSLSRHHILLVEDDLDVAYTAEKNLRHAGFTVEVATTEEEGLSLYAAGKDRICLLFTDIILASGNGVHLADAVRAQDPQLPILLTSGFTDDSLKNRSLRRDRYLFLPKPYNRVSLYRMIREALTSNGQNETEAGNLERPNYSDLPDGA